MTTTARWFLGVFVIGFLGSAIIGLTTMGTYNSFISLERGLVAQYEQNKNNYDNMFKKFREAAQVTTMQADDLERVYKSAIQGRYGENGSQAVFQMIKEQNPNLDSTTYKRLQDIIVEGRDTFEDNQKLLIDKKRTYETVLATFPSNIIASIFGFPKINLEEFGIVTSGRTSNAFETKKDEEIKLR